MKAFFAGSAVQPCTATHDPFAPTPITPTTLALVKPVGGLAGRTGSTLTVVLETIIDLERQVVGATLQAEQELPSGSSFGGLRGGYARITSTSLQLHHLSFVSGVQVTGTFPIEHGRLLATDLRIEGSQAAGGTVRVGASAHVSGTLGGHRFDVNLTKVKLARATSSPASVSWTALNPRFRDPVLARVR